MRERSLDRLREIEVWLVKRWGYAADFKCWSYLVWRRVSKMLVTRDWLLGTFDEHL